MCLHLHTGYVNEEPEEVCDWRKRIEVVEAGVREQRLEADALEAGGAACGGWRRTLW
ncbi:hypothetical protein YC2023_040107 [Brassica napus]